MPAVEHTPCARSKRDPSGGQKGFSLLEVLVAFAILSISLGVLLQVFSGGLRNAAVSEEYTYAVLYAESLLAAVGKENGLTEGIEEGEVNDTYSWRLTVMPYVEDELSPDDIEVDPYWVVMEVFWGSDSRRRSVVLETLRLAPREF